MESRFQQDLRAAGDLETSRRKEEAAARREAAVSRAQQAALPANYLRELGLEVVKVLHQRGISPKEVIHEWPAFWPGRAHRRRLIAYWTFYDHRPSYDEMGDGWNRELLLTEDGTFLKKVWYHAGNRHKRTETADLTTVPLEIPVVTIHNGRIEVDHSEHPGVWYNSTVVDKDTGTVYFPVHGERIGPTGYSYETLSSFLAKCIQKGCVLGART